MNKPPPNASDRNTPGRRPNGVNGIPKAARPTVASKIKEKPAPGQKNEPQGLEGYQLGDCLGKGAFGSVYRALNWGTGETVAVKQIRMADLPKNEIRVIMLEIDLLKNLNHPNIVKYHGFRKSTESLYIVLEYCENGSLHSICKNFGKFPENLVALYMSQVLHGLQYLHEQGVIHRDIKGANILTTKEGTVKLADFGVATKATPGLHESAVVGTPYWMAPEVIELSGASTASDIWSLGCTVIELLDGKPPYHKLQPMPALFRIVNDDHPPLPESTSQSVRDFLMQCFQKDPNLRVSAKKLLKHPWIVSARRTNEVKPVKPTKYDEAVKSVQQWNEALNSDKNNTVREQAADARETGLGALDVANNLHANMSNGLNTTDPILEKPRPDPESFASPGTDKGEKECWDDDFASSIGSASLKFSQLNTIDNLDGKFSANRLKAFALVDSSSPSPGLEGNANPLNHPDSSQTEAYPIDAHETVKPRTSPKKTQGRAAQQQQQQQQQHQGTGKADPRTSSQPKTQILRGPTSTSGPGKASRSVVKPVSKDATKPLAKAPSKQPTRPPGPKRTSSLFREQESEDYSDLIGEDEDESVLQKKLQPFRSKQDTSNHRESPTSSFAHVDDLKSSPRSLAKTKTGQRRYSSDTDSSLRRTASSVEIMKYADKVEDAEDFSDVFGHDGDTALTKPDSESGSERGIKNLKMLTKISNHSWLGDEDDEDDPFAQLEEEADEMDLETKVAKDRYVKTCELVTGLIGSLNTTQPDAVLADVSEQLTDVLFEFPGIRSVIISSHGLLPILEILEGCPPRDICLNLLKAINIIIMDNVEIQENFCFVGGIPIVTQFAHKKYPSDIRLEAAVFVRQMYQTSTLTLQMFISCGGLNVLVEFLEEDYDAERDLVLIGVNGIWSVFALQGSTPKNDFCRILSRSSVLYPLSLVLNRVLDEEGELAELVEGRIVTIFHLFSQAENHVKESVADRMILKRVLKDLRRMSSPHLITMLKFIKNLSMLATTLDSLQNSNAIEVLTDLLSSSMKQPNFDDISNNVVNIMFNLCRLSKTRQEDAALSGIIPILQEMVRSKRPVKEFALPILCEMAHSGKVGRKILWQNKGLTFYISVLSEPYWQVLCLDAIFVWLQEELARVEEHLLRSSFSDKIVHCFVDPLLSTGDSFENLLEPLQKLLRLSPPIAATLAHPKLFSRMVQKLNNKNNKKAIVRGNLLRILRSICDASEEQGALIRHYGLYDAVQRLAEGDPAILVRNMAADLLQTSSEADSLSSLESERYRPVRRASSATMTPPALVSSSSQPPTPQHSRTSTQGPSYFDTPLEYGPVRPRQSQINGTPLYRPASRDGSKSSLLSGGTLDKGVGLREPNGIKVGLPRPSSVRPGRMSVSPRKEEQTVTSSTPTPTPGSTRPPVAFNGRRRRLTSGQ